MTCVWFVKHHGPGVHVAHFMVNIAHFIVEGHGSGLAGLMVLKGIVFGLFLWLFLPFFHRVVLKGGGVVTYGLQVSSVPSVDSAVGGLDHVGVSTFECFSHGASHPLDGAGALFVVEELDLFPNLEGMQISGSMSYVKLFFLFFLELD